MTSQCLSFQYNIGVGDNLTLLLRCLSNFGHILHLLGLCRKEIRISILMNSNQQSITCSDCLSALPETKKYRLFQHSI